MLKNPDWGLMIVFYFFVGGIAGGAYFTAAIVDNFGSARDQRVVRAGYLLALPLALACGILLTLDLGVPWRFLNMLLNLKFWNPMSIGSWAIGLFGLFAFVSSVLAFWNPEQNAALRRKVSLVGSLFGFFLASYTGVLISNTAVPFWSEARLMGALFLASGASTGMASLSLILLLTGTRAGDGWDKIRRADRFSIIFEIVVLALFLALLGSAAAPILTGSYGALFWIGLVGAGLLVPLVIELTRPHARAASALSAVLVLIGGFILRYVILMTVHSA